MDAQIAMAVFNPRSAKGDYLNNGSRYSTSISIHAPRRATEQSVNAQRYRLIFVTLPRRGDSECGTDV